MGRNSYDDMLPEGYREKRSGSRGTSLLIAFIGVLITLIAIVLYLMFTPHDDPDDSSVSDISAVSFSVDEPAILENEAPESRHSAEEEASEVEYPVEAHIASPHYREYKVSAGDTLESVASAFGLTADTLVNFNGITDLNSVKEGSVLRIPDSDGSWYTVMPGDTPSSIVFSRSPEITEDDLLSFNGIDGVTAGDRIFIPYPEAAEEAERIFLLPIADGSVTRRFGSIYNGEKLKGLVMKGEPGSAVVAAADGKIQDFPNDPDYGRGIVIYHDGGYVTEYYGLETIMVGTGYSVTQGEPIGSIGTSSTYFDGEPAVFFSVKQSGIALDPESLI